MVKKHVKGKLKKKSNGPKVKVQPKKIIITIENGEAKTKAVFATPPLCLPALRKDSRTGALSAVQSGKVKKVKKIGKVDIGKVGGKRPGRKAAKQERKEMLEKKAARKAKGEVDMAAPPLFLPRFAAKTSTKLSPAPAGKAAASPQMKATPSPKMKAQLSPKTKAAAEPKEDEGDEKVKSRRRKEQRKVIQAAKLKKKNR
mmetsp:Transcript_75689/g.136516  ORF Transcript_75689/g.136516 Transcript_75689/m.136516 type:complete len:200 (+) Transcript_75689:53-652(+)